MPPETVRHGSWRTDTQRPRAARQDVQSPQVLRTVRYASRVRTSSRPIAARGAWDPARADDGPRHSASSASSARSRRNSSASTSPRRPSRARRRPAPPSPSRTPRPRRREAVTTGPATAQPRPPAPASQRRHPALPDGRRGTRSTTRPRRLATTGSVPRPSWRPAADRLGSRALRAASAFGGASELRPAVLDLAAEVGATTTRYSWLASRPNSRCAAADRVPQPRRRSGGRSSTSSRYSRRALPRAGRSARSAAPMPSPMAAAAASPALRSALPECRRAPRFPAPGRAAAPQTTQPVERYRSSSRCSDSPDRRPARLPRGSVVKALGRQQLGGRAGLPAVHDDRRPHLVARRSAMSSSGRATSWTTSATSASMPSREPRKQQRVRRRIRGQRSVLATCCITAV